MIRKQRVYGMAYAIRTIAGLLQTSTTDEDMSDGEPLNNQVVGGLLAGIEILAAEIGREVVDNDTWFYTGNHYSTEAKDIAK